MPLDPQVKLLLEQMARANVPPYEQLTPQQARDQMLMGSAFLGKPPDVYAVEDRRVAGPNGPLPIRVYRPGEGDKRPCVVYLHGGGWVMGSIQTHDAYCRALANAAAVVVVSVDYRLAPEHKFPAAVEDAYWATRWVSEHAAELGVEPRRLAVAGDSAGGNLAAAVTLMARDRGGPPLIFQALIYPVTDFSFDTPSYRENATGYHLTRAAMIWSWRHYLSKNSDGSSPYASPLRADDLSGLPGALIVTAEFDPLRDEGEAYARKLADAGVPVTLSRYEGMIHGFARRINLLEKSQKALDEVASVLQSACGLHQNEEDRTSAKLGGRCDGDYPKKGGEP
jgi:acetyl esterase